MNIVEEALKEGTERGLTKEQIDIVVGNDVALLFLPNAEKLFGDRLLLNFYDWFKEDETLDIAMHEFEDPSWKDFVSYFHQPFHVRPLLIPCQVQNGEATYPLGMLWADGWKTVGGINRANISLCFLKKYWVSPLTLEASERGIKFAFEYLHCDVLYGITPSENKRSCLYAERVGMEKTGTIPLWTTYKGHPADASIFCIKKPSGKE
jgi:RimJ/RimL family protein N-acetyltransferase